jgi:tetratricopeptide (TPR) repeat protein
MSFDDFPTRDYNSELSTLAENRFERAVVEAGFFVVQQKDRHDYGTDFQIEAKHLGGMSNYRVHVQLKGTDKAANRDGSISVPVARTNLNYMLSQATSVYVCYHVPTDTLLVRSADDVFRDAEHQGETWRSQESLTIRFSVPFDTDFQSGLRARTVAASTTQRDDRLHWVVMQPEKFPEEIATCIPTIIVPETPNDASNVLRSLYERRENEVISKAFEQFVACLGPDNPKLIYAYLSEINLAMRLNQFNRERVSVAIAFIEAVRRDGGPDSLYCRANGHSALGRRNEAKQLYRDAIRLIGGKNSGLEAQCWKNLGSVIEQEGNHAEARGCYEKALILVPQLMEAHMALAFCLLNTGDLEAALHHFDHAVCAVDDVVFTLAARGHRLDVYFRLGMTDKAFDDIFVILPHGDRHTWILPWCARLVYNYARMNNSSVAKAIRFWDAFLRMQPRDRNAQKERFLCLAFAKMHGQPVGIDYQRYEADVTAFLAEETTDAAHLWDRVGHWAQVDGNWEQAEKKYRLAYVLEPDRYGYCLGTALNFRKRFDEALPILLEQANIHKPDALSWFQVATAQEGIGDINGCEESLRRALTLDPDYDLAMFNLGGLYWNHGPKTEAIRVWTDALKRFPSHPEAEKLRREFPSIFGAKEGE